MRNIKVVVEYDGTDYFGFQYQPDVPTIQGVIERVLAKIVEHEVTVYGSGRTDTGVHAAGQVVNFRSDGTIPIDRLCVAMNSLLPRDIVAVTAEEVAEEFHARHLAKSRLYRYDILNRETRSALQGRFCWHVNRPLNVEAMADAAQCLVGFHDLTSFSCIDRAEGSPMRAMREIGAVRCGEHVIVDLRANAFLRCMVRVIVGTLVEVGLGRMERERVREILEAKDRRRAAKTAPPHGLCLVEVEY